MIYFLKGKIEIIEEDVAVIDCTGVGYEFMYINSSDFSVGEYCTVYTLHVIREDDEILVGFKDLKEKKIFSKLIEVKGIGPRTAITALRGTTIDNFVNMIYTDDIKGLKKLPGIGPKAAAQIILDMKGSLKASVISQSENKAKEEKLNPEQEAAKNVLKTLGFKPKDIDDVFNKLPVTLSADQLVEEALKRLGNQ